MPTLSWTGPTVGAALWPATVLFDGTGQNDVEWFLSVDATIIVLVSGVGAGGHGGRNTTGASPNGFGGGGGGGVVRGNQLTLSPGTSYGLKVGDAHANAAGGPTIFRNVTTATILISVGGGQPGALGNDLNTGGGAGGAVTTGANGVVGGAGGGNLTYLQAGAAFQNGTGGGGQGSTYNAGSPGYAGGGYAGNYGGLGGVFGNPGASGETPLGGGQGGFAGPAGGILANRSGGGGGGGASISLGGSYGGGGGGGCGGYNPAAFTIPVEGGAGKPGLFLFVAAPQGRIFRFTLAQPPL